MVIEHDVVIGNQFRAQAGSVLGSDGFSFVTRDKSDVEEIRKHLGKRQGFNKQSWMRIHSLGSVAIGDDVEIGANVTIDRGTVRNFPFLYADEVFLVALLPCCLCRGVW